MEQGFQIEPQQSYLIVDKLGIPHVIPDYHDATPMDETLTPMNSVHEEILRPKDNRNYEANT